MLFALGLVLVHALAIQADIFHHQTYPWNDIKAFCEDKNVGLTTFSQLHWIQQAIGSSKCSYIVKFAIPELVKLIREGKDDLCSVQSINALRAYYAKYLDTSGRGNSKGSWELLPKSLKRFVLAYGMQMSNLCKKNMVYALSSELVDTSDSKELDTLIRDDGPVAQVLSAVSEPGEIFLPGNLVSLLKKQGAKLDEPGSEQLVIQTATSDYIRGIQSVCQHRFKPIYGPLMVPLVRLENMGFNYKSEPLKCDLECPRVLRDISRWSRIVFLCEAMANVRIVDDAEDHKGDLSMVRILSPEEADAIEGARAPPSQEEVESGVYSVYTPRSKVALAGEIYDKSDEQLDKSIKSFKTNHGEEHILKKRLRSKGIELVKKQLKDGHFGLVFSAAWKGLMRKKSAQSVSSPTKEFVESLNKMVEDPNSDGAVKMSDTVITFMGGLILSAIFIVAVVGVSCGIIAVTTGFGR